MPKRGLKRLPKTSEMHVGILSNSGCTVSMERPTTPHEYHQNLLFYILSLTLCQSTGFQIRHQSRTRYEQVQSEGTCYSGPTQGQDGASDFVGVGIKPGGNEPLIQTSALMHSALFFIVCLIPSIVSVVSPFNIRHIPNVFTTRPYNRRHRRAAQMRAAPQYSLSGAASAQARSITSIRMLFHLYFPTLNSTPTQGQHC